VLVPPGTVLVTAGPVAAGPATVVVVGRVVVSVIVLVATHTVTVRVKVVVVVLVVVVDDRSVVV